MRVPLRVLFAALTAALPCARIATAQLPQEGRPLANDAYLPVAEAPVAALRAGDGHALGALAEGGRAELAWTRAFEAWREALVAAQPGDAAPVGPLLTEVQRSDGALVALAAELWPDTSSSFERRTEAVPEAVLRRLAGLPPEVRADWTARFAPLGAERLTAIFADATLSTQRVAALLAGVERELPATRAALRAAVWRAEYEFEAGRPRSARVWLARADRHAALIDDQAAAASVARRRLALDALRPTPRPPATWSRATEFAPIDGHLLLLPGFQKPRSFARIEGPPGLAFLGDGRIAVQTTGSTWILAERKIDERAFLPWKLAFELGQPIPRSVERSGRDWPMYPLTNGDTLYLVSGRADGRASNLLQRIRAPRDIELPIAEWSLGGDGLYSEDGTFLPLEEVLEPGMWEFQPGPILIEDVLYVQARQWQVRRQADQVEVVAPGEAQTWLLALDARSGRPRWRRLLMRGTDLVPDFGTRFGRADLIRTPAQPLRATEDTLFVATNLGAAFLVELSDGRLVSSLRNHRRSAEQRGWESSQRPDSYVRSRNDAAPVLLWAPSDGDELYAVRAARDWAPAGAANALPFVAAPPLELGESETLLGGEREALVFGRAGARRTVSAHALRSGERLDSIYLGREESPIAGALVDDRGVLFAAEGGLYRLDRTRELYLGAFHPLAVGTDFAPGGLWSRGDELFLLVESALFRFRMK